ncbi:HzsA-related protein [Novipirellula artificiosorum]|uniref:Hydrazine synthase alpha subunit middle domain-containing protein n=1 Tax=Novipirellula artificiosorum TaxID=2528016 RepID=A0A5C6D1H6_9BACT|nr:hypothetical protein [Novipirellula artificiosorum]TWU28749.1 hypothetical protein Poly41_69110 [Novipirellula artificiosorum]
MKRPKQKLLCLVLSSLFVWTLTVRGLGADDIPPYVRQSWLADFDELVLEIIKANSDFSKAGSSEDPSVLDKHALIWPSDRDPLDIELRRALALIDHLRWSADGELLEDAATDLRVIRRAAESLCPDQDAQAEQRRRLYLKARAVRRKVALANSLLDFNEIFFSTGEPIGGAIQEQMRGRLAQRGELLVLADFKQSRYRLRPLLEEVSVVGGRLGGQRLRDGSHLSMDLSFDGSKLLFEWCAKRPPKDLGEDSILNPSEYTPDNTFNLFCYDFETSALTQLTDTRYNDAFPCWLPSGRIAFVSERRETSVRCQPAGHSQYRYNLRSFFQPCGTLFSMAADGSDVVPLSWHETTELFPRVTNDGRIVYTRWDYIDRDFNAGQGIWFCMPDGRDPRAPHGNYPFPHNAMDVDSPDFDKQLGHFRDRRRARPWAEYGIRPIPGSDRLIAVAGVHHSSPRGELVLIDPRRPDDHTMAQVKRITGSDLPSESPEVSIADRLNDKLPYAWPWPLSEDFYLVSHLPTGSLVLLDRFGNRDVLYRGSKPVQFAIPRKPRETPPVIPIETFQGERAGLADHRPATISVMNVYQADMPWPEATLIKSLRIVQVFPRPWSSPYEHVGESYMSGTINRMPLGTVPVEEDGSVYFEAPIECEIYFQALDQNGLAVQSMRSGTYVHPGEQMSCIGCHERTTTAPPAHSIPLAMTRSPSKMKPEVGGLEPVNYYRLVKPVLEEKCIECHVASDVGLQSSGYRELEPYAFYYHAGGGDDSLMPEHGGNRTVPGQFGARASRLGQALFDDRHQQYLSEGRFTADDRRRITLWLDLNSVEFGSSSIDAGDQARQRAGEIVWPRLDFDPAWPQRVEAETK